MRKMLCLMAAAMLLNGTGTAEGQVPRDRGAPLPGDDFPTYPVAILERVGRVGFKFLSYPLGARAGALSGAVSTLTGDAHGLFWNPAGLAFMKAQTGQAFGGHTEWIADITYEHGGLVYNVDGVNAFGFGFMSVDNGSAQGTAVNSASNAGFDLTTSFKVKEYMAIGGYARKITDRFSIGGSVKVFRQNLGTGRILDLLNNPTTIENEKTNYSIDLGTYFNTGFRSVAIGLNVNNFARSTDYQGDALEPPRRAAMAFSADILALTENPRENQKAMIYFDVEKPFDANERPLLAGEYTYQAPDQPIKFSARVGYRFNHDTETYSVGGGLDYVAPNGRGISVNYAYKRFNDKFFDAVQIVSGSVNF